MHKEALTKHGQVLFPSLAEFSQFYMAGGTALALQIGHRVSVDFDLFSPDEISRTLFTAASHIFGQSLVQPVVNNRDELTILVDDVKVTFLSYPFPVVTPLVPTESVKLLSITEIGATKAYSIGRRGTYKDYVDLYFIVNGSHATVAEIIEMANQKFGGAFNSRLFTEQLLFMDDITDYAIDFLAQPVTPLDILAFFRTEVERLELE